MEKECSSGRLLRFEQRIIVAPSCEKRGVQGAVCAAFRPRSAMGLAPLIQPEVRAPEAWVTSSGQFLFPTRIYHCGPISAGWPVDVPASVPVRLVADPLARVRNGIADPKNLPGEFVNCCATAHLQEPGRFAKMRVSPHMPPIWGQVLGRSRPATVRETPDLEYLHNCIAMFESLQDGLQAALKSLRGKGKLTEANMRDGLKLVEQSLLEADVSYSVVQDFMERVTERALGQRVLLSLDPTQQVVGSSTRS